MTESVANAFIFEHRDIFGLSVASGEKSLVAAAIADRITTQIRTQLTFVNANLINICCRDYDLRQSLEKFFLLNDGFGIDIAARMLCGSAFPDNLNGTDFIPTLLSQRGHSWRIFIVGATQDVIQRAAAKVAETWPHHDLVGYHQGYYDLDEQLPRKIADSNPHLVLVGMGNPLQELWISENIPHLCNCAIAVGAWFDFLSGEIPRAPSWIRTIRLEWLYRLSLEPTRLAKRYILGNSVFLLRVFSTRLGFVPLVAAKRPAR